MKLNLQNLIKKGEKTEILLTLQERLPEYLHTPCQVAIELNIKKQDDYWLLHLKTQADLHINCQRCAEDFVLPYINETELAVCETEARAESLLALYDCIVDDRAELSLDNIITDELYLYVPQFHPDLQDCDKIVHQYISNSQIN